VGGIHGGYEWNSALLAYEFIDYFTNNSESIPDNLTVTIIPSANPDGIYDVIQKEGRFTADDIVTENRDIGLGRFNANDVDLNRNFDCNWQASSMWKGSEVLAGTKAFSEPEAATIRDFIMATDPVAVVFWHSQAGAVYASECNEGVLSETLDIVNAYADAADYNAVLLFDAYEITGDAEGWLASIGIPAITVEIGTHVDIEWNKNLRGVQALFNYYSTI
jgi:predicted deacylase